MIKHFDTGGLFWGGNLVPPSPVGSQRNRMTFETPNSLAGKCLADFQVPSFPGLKSSLPKWQVVLCAPGLASRCQLRQ